MIRLMRSLLAGLWLWLVLSIVAMILTGCGSPAKPSPVPAGPRVLVHGAPDASYQSTAETLLPQVEACIGGAPVPLERFPIDWRPGAFYCGSIWAAGCFHVARIEVADPWYADALWHEYIHMVLYKQGKPWDHSAPEFARCDSRNVGKSMIYADHPVRVEVQ